MIRCIARRQASFCRAAMLTSIWHCRPRGTRFGTGTGRTGTLFPAGSRQPADAYPPRSLRETHEHVSDICRQFVGSMNKLRSAIPHFIRLNDCSSNNFRFVPSIASIGTALENSYRLRGNSRVQYRNITTTRDRG
jgi:hypothetical protein